MSEWEVTILGEVLRLQYGKDHKTLANGSIVRVSINLSTDSQDKCFHYIAN